jgi:uncharacterized protein DUF664
MSDAEVKAELHQRLRGVRQALVWKLDGLGEYDIRRPLTPTGTNLLGLVKHNAIWEARYFGDVFGRPFPEALPRWDDAEIFTDLWATEHETRSGVVDFYHRVWAHSDATINALDLDARGQVPWWGQQDVTLFSVMVHLLSDTTRHAGHADIVRETLDGAVGEGADSPSLHGLDAAYWAARNALIERAAQAAGG